ncbi:MAG: alpha/beta hydrolase [Bacteroidota bacterium]
MKVNLPINLLLFVLFIFFSNDLFSQTKIKLYNSTPNCDLNKKDVIEETELDLRFFEIENPEMWYYPSENKKDENNAILVIPGGGYQFLSFTNEGTNVAKWLNSIGIDAFVLKHRLPYNYNGSCKQKVAIEDAQKALEIIKKDSEKFRVNKENVGVIGFSAGGHLASSVSNLGLKGVNKPDFAILVYPVIQMNSNYKSWTFNSFFGEEYDEKLISKYSNEKNVNSDTPPTLLIHSNNDNGTPPTNSISYYLALRKNNIPASIHIWEDGGHGYGVAKDRGTIESWLEIAKDWMQLRGVTN